MKKVLLFLALFISQLNVNGQVPGDTPERRLFLLCKTWGYVKYFHQDQCEFQWDAILNSTIIKVLQSTTNEDYNSAMLGMLNQVGTNGPVTTPGVLPDTNLLVKTDWILDPRLSQTVRNFLAGFSNRTTPSRSSCFVRLNNNNPKAIGFIDFTKDTISIPIDYSVVSDRLTVLFYYWNVINYFFPYRNLTDKPWDSILEESIPVFRKDQNELECHKNIMKLSTRINDSHSYTGSNLLSESFWNGNYQPKMHLSRIEDQCVVVKIDSIEGVVPGDILVAIDGKAITEYEDSLGQFLPNGTPAAKYRNIYDNMVRGRPNTTVILTFINQRNQRYMIEVTRNMPAPDWNKWKNNSGAKKSYNITACGYGYVDMGKLMPAEVPAMYAALKSAPAIIFDIRNYPNGTMWNIGPLIFSSNFTSAIIYRPALTRGTLLDSFYYFPGWYYKATDIGNLGVWKNPDPYSGNVYLLVNQETQSHAEYTCQYFSYHPKATVIGTQTAGADGNVTAVKLPGGITSYFTSLGWYYSDGYQQQRIGVKIDSIVAPTIKGIREGQDEILLAALKCHSGFDKQELKPFVINVFPNPVTSGSVKISFSMDQNSEFNISLIDLTGRKIHQDSQMYSAGEQTIHLDLSQIVPGVYLLKAQNNRESVITKLIIQ